MNSRILKTDMEDLEWGVVWGVVAYICKHSIWGAVRVSMTAASLAYSRKR